MKTLVTGGAGFIGAALVTRLVATGRDVVVVVKRRPATLPATPPGAMLIAAHQLGEPLPDELLRGVEQVVHLAHDMTPGNLRKNVDGTIRWFDQAQRAEVPTQVYVSSYSADAASPSEYGRAKYELERYVAARGGIIVRPGLVLGRGGAFGAMVTMLRRFPILPVPGGHLRVFLTDLRDMLDVMTSVDDSMIGRTLNLFVPQPIALRRLLERTRSAIGGRGAVVSIPSALALPALTMAAALNSRFQQCRESLAALAASQSYAYPSSYPALYVAERSLDEILAEAVALEGTSVP